jgi:hypothetical protein
MEGIFTSEDVYTSLKPLLIISRIFGVAPFSLTRIKSSQNLQINFEFIDIVCVSVWTLGYIMSGCYTVYSVVDEFYGLPAKIIFLIVIVLLTAYSTATVTLITSISFNRRKLPSMLSRLMNVDHMIEYRKVTNTHTRTWLGILTQAILIVSLISLFLVKYYIQSNESLISIVNILSQTSCITCNIVMTLQFGNLTRALKNRYKCITEDLEHTYNVKNSAMVTSVEAQNHTSPSDSPSSYIFHYKELPLYSITRSVSLSALSESYKIGLLRLVYVELYECVMLLNSYFGIPILFEILLVMVTSVSALYAGFYFARLHDGDVKSCILGYYLIFFGILFLITFAWLIICCHAVSDEVNKSVIYIQKIAACLNVKYETTLQLEKLSSQLNIMKVSFSACGFISLSLPTLCTMIGGILTYILVVVQVT